MSPVNPFQKATKKKSRLRAALIGPSGSGKTFTALRVAKGLGGKVALIDTERGSASKYAGQFEFDVLELESFHPSRYIEAIEAAGAAGYDVLIIDSLSHAWTGKDGALELVDKATARTSSKNSFGAWREVTPLHNQLIDAILRARPHVIATMRVKQEYVLEKDEKSGKQAPRKVGLAPVQRDGMEYEFDLVGDLDDSQLVVTKSRCPALSKAVLKEPGEDLAQILSDWLSDGTDEPEPQRAPRAVSGGDSESLRGRLLRLSTALRQAGLGGDASKSWCARVLSKDVPTSQWTVDDVAHLEDAVIELSAALPTQDETLVEVSAPPKPEQRPASNDMPVDEVEGLLAELGLADSDDAINELTAVVNKVTPKGHKRRMEVSVALAAARKRVRRA